MMTRMASMGEAGAAVRTAVLAVLIAGVALVGIVVPPTSRAGQPQTGDTRLNRDGVPEVYYAEAGWQSNPVTIAEWGLTSSPRIERAADWLVKHQHLDGSWRYGFDYLVTGRVWLRAGWASALAQAQAIRVLVRAHAETRNERYANAVRAAVGFLNVPTSKGGVRTELDGGLWLEEYPTDPPSRVLNGFMVALTALWEARHLAPGVLSLYEEGRGTLESHLGRWDVNGEIAYDLLHEQVGGPPRVDRGYADAHEMLLRDLLNQRGSTELARWLRFWY